MVGNFLKERLEDKGLTVGEFAQLAEVDRATASQHLNGHRMPSPQVRRRYARALDLSPQTLEEVRSGKPITAQEPGTVPVSMANIAYTAAATQANEVGMSAGEYVSKLLVWLEGQSHEVRRMAQDGAKRTAVRQYDQVGGRITPEVKPRGHVRD